ncbi:MAG: cyclic pyranopterin monophosphate synthase MoaC [Acidithiobacillus sp.]
MSQEPSPNRPLTHFNARGEAHMVAVTDKPVTERRARAEGAIRMQTSTLERLREGSVGKGDVLAVARIAAIQAAKKTADLIPLAHPLALSAVDVEFADQDDPAQLLCRVDLRCSGQTGVEMEALTAVSVALLTVYDMCKAIDRGMEIISVRLLEKSGGRSGHWRREP